VGVLKTTLGFSESLIETLFLFAKLRTMTHRFLTLLLASCFVVAIVITTRAQQVANQSPASVDEKSQQIIDKAVQALGGPSYLSVKTVVGKGFYTSFHEGVSQLPAKFLDYVSYPDHERTEFTGGGIKTINANAGETGWLFDGAVKTITDQGPLQIEDFKRAMRTSLENLLRGWWKKAGGKIVYVGRREAGLAKRNETIRLTFPTGFWVEYEFGAKDGLPAKIIYKRARKNPDSGDEEETTEEDQFFKFIVIDGVNAPWVIDHYVNGKQTSRINYESVQYNQNLADSLFAKPENVKAIK
jgi:outer membrane lipoprotein-sorting protein